MPVGDIEMVEPHGRVISLLHEIYGDQTLDAKPERIRKERKPEGEFGYYQGLGESFI